MTDLMDFGRLVSITKGVTQKSRKFSEKDLKQIKKLQDDISHITGLLYRARLAHKNPRWDHDMQTLIRAYEKDSLRLFKRIERITKLLDQWLIKLNKFIPLLKEKLNKDYDSSRELTLYEKWKKELFEKEVRHMEQFNIRIRECKQVIEKVLLPNGELHKLLNSKSRDWKSYDNWQEIKEKINEGCGGFERAGISDLEKLLVELEKHEESIAKQIREQQLMKKRYKNEPKDLEHFNKIYGGMHELRGQIFKAKEEEIVKMVDLIKYFVSGFGKEIKNKGAGTRFLFPLTSAQGPGEFVRGVLKVIAPKAQVTFLVTPKSNMLPHGHVSLSWASQNPLEKNLREHLSNCIKPGDKKIIVLDDMLEGKTANAIKRALEILGMFKPGVSFEAYDNHEVVVFIGNFMPFMYRLGWGKDTNGRFAADEANMLKYAKKHSLEMGIAKEQFIKENGFLELFKRCKREDVFNRRYLLNLGIATAKSYLQIKNKKSKN